MREGRRAGRRGREEGRKRKGKRARERWKEERKSTGTKFVEKGSGIKENDYMITEGGKEGERKGETRVRKDGRRGR